MMLDARLRIHSIKVIGIAMVLVLAGVMAFILADNSDAIKTNDQNVGGDSIALASYTSNLRGAVVNPPRVIPDFSLPSTNGESFTLSEHQGKTILIYFGYMTCPDVCPTTLADLQRAYRTLGTLAEEVEVLFITVDPERDTMERLEVYTNAFHSEFIAVRSDDEEALESLMQSFGIEAVKREVDSALGYLVDHTASVFVLSPDGTLMEQFLYGTPYEDIAHDVELIQRNHVG